MMGDLRKRDMQCFRVSKASEVWEQVHSLIVCSFQLLMTFKRHGVRD